ncbi:hypothetical protein KW794_01950, partial [Candidatus Saccharibacteria bacterium]|nr:hypothetical protein [Candidatus Saccharibacteria bacterium]
GKEDESGTSKQPSNQNSSSSSPSSNSGKSLPNNGPGNVIAIFAGSTLAAAGLHYIISLRRFNKYGN